MNFGNSQLARPWVEQFAPYRWRSFLTGGVTLPVVTGTVTPASFTVTGEANSTYSITLPSSAITLTGPSGTMNRSKFCHSTPSNYRRIIRWQHRK